LEGKKRKKGGQPEEALRWTRGIKNRRVTVTDDPWMVGEMRNKTGGRANKRKNIAAAGIGGTV